jgi:hypothetical protein
MLIIADRRIPAEAKEKLSAVGTLLELETEGIVYPAISGHPDIFFCKTPEMLIVHPDLPEYYFEQLRKYQIQFITGNPVSRIENRGWRMEHRGSSIENPVSSIQYPSLSGRQAASIRYNAAVNDHFLVHRLEFTDLAILENCHALKKIPVKQGYTRCNLLLLKEDHYLTSDAGIHKALQRAGQKGICVSPEGILLPGFPNGFIGGAMGVLNDTLFIIGSLDQYKEGDVVRKYLESLDYRIVELYDGSLFDGGGILFI